MTNDIWRYCCPKCDSVNLQVRTTTGDYRCRNCGQIVQNRKDKLTQ